MRLVNALAAPAFVIILAAMFTASMAGAATGDTKTAEQTFKNIVQLKGTPADQLIPTMQFISASLGVECNFCHVEGKMDSDDKPAKKTAREMMAMMATLNRESFGGNREVTCYSCHHGAEHPTSTPPVLESDMPARAEHAPPARPTTITADQIIEQYRAAVGGEEAMKRTTSRVAKGEILVAGHETPIELLTKAPNKRMSISVGSAIPAVHRARCRRPNLRQRAWMRNSTYRSGSKRSFRSCVWATWKLFRARSAIHSSASAPIARRCGSTLTRRQVC